MIYAFGNQFSFTLFGPGPRAMTPLEGVTADHIDIDFDLPTTHQQSDVGGNTNILIGCQPTEPLEVREFVEPGFRYLDVGMKAFFGDIRIPSKDNVRFLRTRIAGSRRGIQVWNDLIKRGRVQLPVMSISRTSHNYNPEKFSPPHHPMRRRYTNRERTRVALAWRPVPWLVEYTLSIWAESKRDAEHAISQILTRYNPLAEFRVSDNHTVGVVTLRYGSYNDSSDKQATAEQFAKVKYELTTVAEAWLSLPEQIVPTITGISGGIKTTVDFEPWDRFRTG